VLPAAADAGAPFATLIVDLKATFGKKAGLGRGVRRLGLDCARADLKNLI
jgi:hypothetical protein